jgi:acyl-coenzyme A synthetase/AMP-(fatty) acid ligase
VWQTETGAIMISPLPGATPDRSRNGDATVSRNFDRHSNESRKIVAQTKAAIS